MPTYGYRCVKCSTEFEAWERMADPPAGRCPACGARGKRLFFPTGIVFKGSGFYKTDSRSSDGGSAAHRDSQPAPGEAKEKVPAASGSPASDGAPTDKGSSEQRSEGGESKAQGERPGKEAATGVSPGPAPTRPAATPKRRRSG